MSSIGNTDIQQADVSMNAQALSRGSRRARVAGVIALLLFVGLLGFRSVHLGGRAATDSGVFAGIGVHLLHGKALYRDAWDHKPPMIYLLNALALGIGDGTLNSIRTLERIGGAFLAVVAFGVIWLGFASRSIAGAATVALLALFYHHDVLEGGNLTEEYASVFLLLGILSCLKVGTGWTLLKSYGSGLFFSLAVFTKEPFLISSFPWFVCMLYFARARWALCLAGYFAGVLTTALSMTAYLVCTGAFGAWMDVLSFNVHNSAAMADLSLHRKMHLNVLFASESLFSNSWATLGAGVIGILGLFNRGFLRQHAGLPLFVAIAFFMDFYATSLSGRGYGHYYLQLVPSFVLLAASGMSYVRYLLQDCRLGRIPILLPALFPALFMVIDLPTGRAWFESLFAKRTQAGRQPAGEFIRSHTGPDDTIWVSSGHVSNYYVETGRLSPTKYLAPFPHVFINTMASTAEEKKDLVRGDLFAAPPKYVVVREPDRSLLQHLGLIAWIESEYSRTEIVEERLSGKQRVAVSLWEHKSMDPTRIALVNGGFEEGVWKNGVPYGWHLYAPNSGSCVLERETSNRDTRVRLAKRPDGESWGSLIRQELNVEDLRRARGRKVRVQAQMAADKESAYLGLQIASPPDRVDWRYTRPSSSDDSEQIEVIGEVPSNASMVRVILGSLTTSPVVFDDVSVEIVK